MTERCGAHEGATGITCGLYRYHPPAMEHEGTTTQQQETAVGYPLFVRWPWNESDRDCGVDAPPKPKVPCGNPDNHCGALGGSARCNGCREGEWRSA